VTAVADEYDVFLSYARGDDEHGAVTRLADEIRGIFAQRTKRQLRIFIDQQEIATAELWKERISGALHASTLLIAVVTEDYLASQWCRSEWDYFAALERGLAEEDDQPRIFPVFIQGGLRLPGTSPATQKWMRAIRSRQCAELGDPDAKPEAYRDRISRLTDDLIRALGHPSRDDPISRSDRGLEHHHMLTGYVREGTRFVRLLARAANVTIVGMTNEGLATMLQDALNIKRRIANDHEVFWGSLRIVFLSDKLLNSLNDEKSEYPNPAFELSQRELAAGYGRRSIEGFVKRASSSSRWTLFESHHVPPFSGALLEMPDGSRVVQLIIRRPQRRTIDHLYLEFEDQADQYFTAAFEDIIHNSAEVNRVVPIGVPHDPGFLVIGARFFQNVLVDESGQTGWMPIVLVVTWWNRNGRPEPVLQVRTVANSTRELDRVSHLAGYVYLDSYPGSASPPAEPPAEFELPSGMVAFAARNRVRMETGSLPPGELNFVTSRQYLHADKEHLFFYVYEFQLPGHFQFPQRAQMFHMTVERLLQLRKNQSLRNAIELCRAASRLSFPKDAFEIAALNLILHQSDQLGEELLRLANTQGSDFGQLLNELQRVERETRESQRSGNAEVELKGLSGLQYREFFTVLMPLYAKLGIPGAAEALAKISESDSMQHALDRLPILYNDEDLMTNIPVEL
jgi:TIR domain